MTATFVASVLALSTVVLMLVAIVLGVVAHAIRRDLNAVEMPFSAYLSGRSRFVGLACYGCLMSAIAAFAIASAIRPGLDEASPLVALLYLMSVGWVAIAAATARADASFARVDSSRTRAWHRYSAFLAFSSAIMALAIDTWLWRDQAFLERVWPQVAVLAATLIVLFLLLWIVTARYKGAVQKLLMLGIVVWFSAVALMLRH